jgi:hypothetical protein
MGILEPKTPSKEAMPWRLSRVNQRWEFVSRRAGRQRPGVAALCGSSSMRSVLTTSLLLLLIGCSGDRVQHLVSSPSPDKRYVAIVRDVFAEETTGSIPQLFVLPAGQTLRGDTGHLADGGLNGTFAVSWTSSDSLVVEYTAGESNLQLPATTNFGGITITFRPSPAKP